MKKLLFSFVMLACGLLFNAQQMNVTVTGNTVKFSTRVDGTTGTDWTSAPVSLYAYIDAADTSNNSFQNVLGGFPGTSMVDNGTGVYSVSKDLSTLYPSGTIINDIKFIYTNAGGQNPPGGSPGFSVKDPAHTATAATFKPITVSTLSVSDLVNAKKNSFVANGKLYTKQNGNLDITVYDMTGKIVKQSQVKSSDSALELNIKQAGTYIVKVSNGSQTETVKFIK